MEIHGECEPRFKPVLEAFEANFDAFGEAGASVCVTVDGRSTVDLWAGEAAAGKPWEQNTIVNVWSITKTMSALCVLMLADRGALDLHAPVAKYWPAFRANGKDGITVAHVMGHAAGLSGFDPPLPSAESLYDWDEICAQLAAQATWWRPGQGSGYHALTQGYIQGELVRLVDGRTIGTFFREEVAEPLGADFHVGLDPAHDPRVATLVPPGAPLAGAGGVDPEGISERTLESVPLRGDEPASEAWRRAEIPSAGGIGNARSVARIHSAIALGGTVDGVELLSEAGVERIFEEQANGIDRVMQLPVRFGMGFGLTSPEFPLTSSERACFWGGWGGSLAMIDLDRRMTVSYVMNRMAPELIGDPRGPCIALAAYRSVADC